MIDIGSDGSRTLRIRRQWGGDDYIDLANTYLFVEAQIVADDDTAFYIGYRSGRWTCELMDEFPL
jgi:hypothetical protein